jgi:chromosome segregation ATPase
LIIAKFESENEDLKKYNAELKRKELELKDKLDKTKTESNELADLKKQVEQFKSETTYLLKRNDTLLNENQQLKKKSDSTLLEKNCLKHKMDEILVDYEKIAKITKVCNKVDSCMQTDNFNYDDIIKPLYQRFEKQENDLKHNETLLKNTLDEFKLKLKNMESNHEELKRKWQNEYETNCEMGDRNEFLFNTCEKLKMELSAQADELQKHRLDFDIEKEVLETTINQYKKFIDFITHADPDLLKKLQLFIKK